MAQMGIFVCIWLFNDTTSFLNIIYIYIYIYIYIMFYGFTCVPTIMGNITLRSVTTIYFFTPMTQHLTNNNNLYTDYALDYATMPVHRRPNEHVVPILYNVCAPNHAKELEFKEGIMPFLSLVCKCKACC